jgi:hypothetical protein
VAHGQHPRLGVVREQELQRVLAGEPVGERGRGLGLDLERSAGELRRLPRADLRARVARGESDIQRGQRAARHLGLAASARRQLALASGGDKGFETLADDFDDLVLLFADDTAQEIEQHAAAKTGAPDSRAVSVYESYLKRQRKDFRINFHVRVLEDILNQPGLMSGVFLALVDGKRYPPALAAVDPNGAEALNFGARLGEEDTVFLVADSNKGGIWYHCDRRAEVDARRKSPEKRLADALDYTVETTIARDTDLAGTTTLRFKTLMPKLRVLPVHLLPSLRLEAATYAVEAAAGGESTEPAWKPLPFVQEEEREDATAAVVFPEPLAKGAVVRLKLSYKGDKVLVDGGDKNYYVGARESWYPNVGVFSDPALFDLTYRVPAGNQIISVGTRLDEKTEGRESVSHWKTEQPVQVAGFNYGKFKEMNKQDETSKIDVQVFTNPGTPDIINQINSYLSQYGAASELPEGEYYTLGGEGRRLGLLLHHDDAEREFAYDREFRLSPLAEALDKADAYGITVVGMRRDWGTVFGENDHGI